MKYLYILVSDDTDFYFEQALLSITSLRIWMPNAFVSLLVDDVTEANLKNKRGNILGLVDEFKSVMLETYFNKKARSRWLKTSMRQHVEGDFLYIDNDTIIADDLSSLHNINIDLGAILDEHIYLSKFETLRPIRMKEIKAMFKKRKFNLPFDFKIYFNGGVFFCRDCKTGYHFFSEWHRLWLHCFELGELTDQPSLNQANFNLGNIIQELNGIWNCQILNDGALKFLCNAKIIHYFETQPAQKVYLLANREYVKYIKETGIVDDNIRELLKTPKTLFSDDTHLLVLDKPLREFYHSALYNATKKIYFTKLGAGIEFIFYRIRKYIFTPLCKKLSRRK